MQSCAFFWEKINMIRAYMGDSDLAIVLGERWLVVVLVRRGLVFVYSPLDWHSRTHSGGGGTD